MKKTKKLIVTGIGIETVKLDGEDFFSLTDIARKKNKTEPKDVVKNWLRNRSTIEFLGLWEQLNNPQFKGVEFDPLLFEAGENSFTMSPSKWIEITNAKGIISKSGNKGGTFAHKEIAFEFASWISPGFKLYLIKEFQRLKESESKKSNLEWSVQRTLSKVNYAIHTDAIKENLIPGKLNKKQISTVYATEADILNMALFGKTSKTWRAENPGEKGNMRDFASIEQLVVLANIESINALLIRDKICQGDRLAKLNEVAIQQMKSLLSNNHLKKLSQYKKIE